MKRLFASLLLAVTLFTALPAKKAEAGLLITGSMCIADGWDDFACGFGIFLGVVAGGPAIIAGGIVALFNPQVGLWIAGGGLVLDAEESIKKDKLQIILAERYPFIDDAQVVAELAQAVRNNFMGVENDVAIVKVSSGEIEDILSKCDLSGDQVSKIVSDLN